MNASRLLILILCGSALVAPVFAAGTPDTSAWKAGTTVVDITPSGPVGLVGYGPRVSVSVAHPLYAKVLALEDYAGARMIFVTTDLLGIPIAIRNEVVRQVGEKFNLRPETILLNSSHTHSGPSVNGQFVTDPELRRRGEEYGRMLTVKLVQGIEVALGKLEPAKLHYTHARAAFGMNRRLLVGNEIIINPNPDGPVDHDVPVLRVTGPDDNLRAVMFGYACHNTAANFLTVNADYAGYAQDYIEENRPGVVALFMMGAGADQNPYPRHVSLDQAQQHGRTLANAVETALSMMNQRVVNGPVRSAYDTVAIDYANISRAALERGARSSLPLEKTRAESLLKDLAAGKEIPQSYPCPVQVVRFGVDILFVGFSGETTVGYSLRLKQELAGGPAAVWVAGYCNDFFGYLGTKDVIIGGGYEGYRANLDRHPGPWTPDTEDRVIAKAYELIQMTNR